MIRSVLFSALMSLAPFAASAGTYGPYSDLVVFGDSYSDPGNLFNDLTGTPSPVPFIYPNGQFTDGDTWAVQLGADFASGTNYAFGGSKAANDPTRFTGPFLPGVDFVDYDIPDLEEQVNRFLGAPPALGKAPTIAILTGGNDLRGQTDPTAAAVAINEAVTAVARSVTALLGAGYGDVTVFGLSNLGRLPSLNTTPFAALGDQAAQGFNGALQLALSSFAGVGHVDYFDTYGLLETIAANPLAYGFTNVTDACLTALQAGAIRDCTGYLYYDDIHITDAGHAVLAEAFAAQALAPIPLPAGGLLLITGLGALGLMRRRTSAQART